jgi:hypothetical protein
MIDADYQSFCEAWMDAHEVMPGGKVLSPGAMTMCFDALSRFPLDVVLLAIKRHVAIGKFAPIPKDVIDILETGNTHVGADEAWAIALESLDECSTVAMTKEIAEALHIAKPVLDISDEIGARMTFKDAYNRILKIAEKPQWYLSLGHDQATRDYGIKKAIQLGRLTSEQAARYLPAPRDGGVVGKLLTGKTIDGGEAPDEFVSRFRSAMNQIFTEAEEREKTEQQRKKDEARQALEKRRQVLIDQAAAQQSK